MATEWLARLWRRGALVVLVAVVMVVAIGGISDGHSYAASGSSPVVATIADRGAASVQRLAATAPDGPLAAFVAPGTVGSFVAIGFNGSVSRGTGLRYAWDFDGSRAFLTTDGASPVIHHAFSVAGNHEVGLRVTDAAGRSAEVFHTIQVANLPHGELRFVPSHPRPGQLVRFRLRQPAVAAPRAAAGRSQASVTAPYVYLWRFGDHRDGSQRLGSLIFPGFHPTHKSLITHAYAHAGRFPMTVQTQNALGNYQTLTTVVPVGSCGAATKLTTATSAAGCGSADPPGTKSTGNNKQVQANVAIDGSDAPVSGQPIDFHVTYKNKAKKKKDPTVNCDPATGPVSDQCPELNVPTVTAIKWHFDDGATDTGMNQHLTHTFAASGEHTVDVIVTFDDGTYSGAVGHVHVYAPQPPAPCPQFSVGPFSGQVDDGSCLIPASVKNAALYHVPAGHSIELGGVTFSPVGDGGLGVSLNPGSVYATGNAKVAVSLKGLGGYVDQVIHLDKYSDHVIHFSPAGSSDPPQGSGAGSASFSGLTLKGADLVMHADGSVSFENARLYLSAFKQTTSLPSLTPDQVANRENEPLTLSVPDIALGGLPLHNLSLVRVPGQGFIGGVDFGLLGANIHADPPQPDGLGLHPDGSFAYAGLTFHPPAHAIPVGEAFYLSSLSLRAGLDPTYLQGTGGLTSNDGSTLRIDGCLALRFAQEVDTGKKVPSCPLGTSSPITASGFGAKLYGDLHLYGFELGQGYVEYQPNGWVGFGGGFNYDIAGAVSIDANLAGAFHSLSEWEVQAGAHVCETLVGRHCLGGDAIVSSRGIGGCVYLPLPFPDVGAWYRWTGGFGLIWHGCGIGEVHDEVGVSSTSLASPKDPFSSPRSPWQALRATRNARLPVRAGPRGALIGLIGQQSAPRVTVTGPGGLHLTDDGRDLQAYGTNAIMRSDRLHETFVVIRHPRRGAYSATTQPGSAPIIRTQHGDLLPPPSIVAHVSGHGRTRVLHYRLRPVRGRTVTFAEIGQHVSHQIGAAHGASGTLRFSAADGPRGSRRIVAQLSDAGIPEKVLRVSSYAAPPPPAIGTPSRLRARVTGSTLHVTWGSTHGAALYRVHVILSDGRNTVILRRAQDRSVILSGFGAGDRAQVSVSAVAADTRIGHTATATAHRRPAPIRPVIASAR